VNGKEETGKEKKKKGSREILEKRKVKAVEDSGPTR